MFKNIYFWKYLRTADSENLSGTIISIFRSCLSLLKRIGVLEDTINLLQLSVENRQFLNQNNQWHHISLNSQFTVVLNGIICFSVRFKDSSLLVLKIRFQVFSFTSKEVQWFSCDRKISMSLLSVLFNLQNRVAVFWNFNS